MRDAPRVVEFLQIFKDFSAASFDILQNPLKILHVLFETNDFSNVNTINRRMFFFFVNVFKIITP